MDELDYAKTLQVQLDVLKEDHRKTQDKLSQIVGAIKVIEHLIHEFKNQNVPSLEEVKTNGS